MTDLKKMYHELKGDSFPMEMKIVLGDREMTYRKRTWTIANEDGATEERGLRYGENPDQEAALYELTSGALDLGDVEYIRPGRSLTAGIGEADMLRFGKHPSKTNFTDVDNALNILKYLSDQPATLVMKHNNPSGVAIAGCVAEAFHKAYHADRIAAMGGAVVVNRPIDKDTASAIADKYVEVVCAPDYEDGTVEILAKRANLRVIRIERIGRLAEYAGYRYLEFKSLIDGGIVVQQSPLNRIRSKADFIPASAERKGVKYVCARQPTDAEYRDMVFGWAVEMGVTSNSVLYVKDGVTVAIGTGEQDRVGVAQIALAKARTKYADMLVWERHRMSLYQFEEAVGQGKADPAELAEIMRQTDAVSGGVRGAVMISDGFFPFRDGVDVGIGAGVTAIVQPGGSIRDFEAIEACNQAEPKVAMVFTGQRAFKH